MMREAAVVLDRDLSPIYWHLPENRTTVSIPDSDLLWDVLWDNRARLYGVAHSHPGRGLTTPSLEDLTTFSAIERGLGIRLVWPIVTQDACVSCWWEGPGKYDYAVQQVGMGSSWVRQLLEYSNSNNKEM